MPYTIPNEADAGTTDQAAPDKVDLDILTAGLSHGVSGTGFGVGPTGVQSGCAVTAQGTPDMTVAVASGVVRIGGRRIAVTGANVTITAAHATNKRRDLVVVDTAGVLTAIAGTASDPTRAALPTITTGKVVLAAVTIPAADTTINTNQITDKRVMIDEPQAENVLWYGANGNDAADNTTAFQNAHDAIPNTAPYQGGTIVIPPGRYRFTGAILSEPTNVTAAVGSATGPTGTFFYAVSAYNAAGETLAVSSTPASITLANQKGDIAWTPVTNAIGYKIYRGTASTDMFFLAFVNGQASSTYSDTAASPKGINTPAAPSVAAAGSGSALITTTYWYVVTAYNINGETQPSPAASVAVTAGQNVTVTITAPANAGGITGYRVFRGTSSAADSQFYVNKTLTTTYVDDGNLTDHSGRKFTTTPVGLPNRWNETGGTGSTAKQWGIPPTVNTSRIGWHLKKKYLKVVGISGKSASADAGGGAFLIPNTANMTMICMGDGTAIQQVGPSLYDISIDDYAGRGGVVGIAFAGVNHCRLLNCFVRDCDVGYWHYRLPNADDCAWNLQTACHASHSKRYALRAGNSYGITLMGGEYGPETNAASICLDRVNSFFANSTHSDGALGIFGPPWGGGTGVAFQNLKCEQCKVALDLDAFGTQSQGLGISINGGVNISQQTNSTSIILRSTNVENPRIVNWLISGQTNGVIDNAIDTLVAASNFSTNRGVSRDSVYNTIKLLDETRVSNTTLANDSELLIYMKASTKYRITGTIFFDTTANADFKYGFVGPASPTLVRMARSTAIPGAAPTFSVVDIALPTAQTLVGTGTTGGYIQFTCIYQNGTNAGYFAFQWAQSTSDAGNTIVRAGSFLDYATIG
jgi:hypothetical protein